MDTCLKGAAMDDVLRRLVAIKDLVRTEIRKIREAIHELKNRPESEDSKQHHE